MLLPPKIQLLIHSRDFEKPTQLEINPGKNLRAALLEAGISPYRGNQKILNCRGLGICGTCKVLILENGDWWDRRACQIQCFKNLEIQLK